MATYDHELILISERIVEDELKNQKTVEDERTILCSKKSVSRNEFYGAATSKFNPEIVLTVHSYEYEDERKVKFKDKKYNVIRTYSTGFEEVELTCERR